MVLVFAASLVVAIITLSAVVVLIVCVSVAVCIPSCSITMSEPSSAVRSVVVSSCSMFAAIRVVSSSGSVNGTRGLGGAMSRSSRPGKKDIGDLVVSQGGRGLGLVLVLVVVSENTFVRIHSLEDIEDFSISLFCSDIRTCGWWTFYKTVAPVVCLQILLCPRAGVLLDQMVQGGGDAAVGLGVTPRGARKEDPGGRDSLFKYWIIITHSLFKYNI